MDIIREVAEEVVAERRRQVEEEGWTAAHDDGHGDGILALAGACYARHAATSRAAEPGGAPPRGWPWARGWWKPKDRRRDLIRAAALIIAEVERMDRLAGKEASAV